MRKIFDVTVIGAGVVGSAIGMTLLRSNPNLKVLILEKESELGLHQTSHNSGVIHSGVYYTPGSYKARLCRRGYDQLLKFCRTHEIPHDICGKIIVATDDWELPILEGIRKKGEANGLTGIRVLEKEQVSEIEPHVRSLRSLFIPQDGIIEYRVVCQNYLKVFQEKGGEVRFGEKVLNINSSGSECLVVSDKAEYSTRYVISAGGLWSDRVAKMTNPNLQLRILPFRGEYYKLKENRKNLVKNLIYPVPDPSFPFLGVHFTRMINGDVEAGPNAVLALSRAGYSWGKFNLRDTVESLTWPGFQKIARKYWKTGMYEMYRSLSKKAFCEALQRLIPEVQESDL
ncbi:MAG: L-2-hydroxyglutarate oxidase, partial [Pseudobdellovibrionaceae bacterium]